MSTLQSEPGHVLMTPTEVAHAFCVAVITVRRWADAGRLTVLKTPGGNCRYLKAESEQLLRDATRTRTDASKPFGP